MGMFSFFTKKDTEFYDLFLASAKYFNSSAKLINEVMSGNNKAEAKISDIINIEHEADTVNDKIIDKLNKTFITPIDREDIYALANGLDDGVDFLQGTLQRAVMYHLVDTSKAAIALSELLVSATDEILKAFSMLHEVTKHEHEILECTYKISKLESEGDRIYREEVAYLFEHITDPIELIKWKDILTYMEDTLDHCEKLSDLVRGVVMKYA